MLEEIVVTGDRAGFGASLVQVGTFRNSRIIDVPLTVNVVPQEVLRAQAVTGIYDALAQHRRGQPLAIQRLDL